MSELAFDMNGDAIVLPASAQYWRVRRFRSPGKQGAPEIVESKDGGPLILPVDVGFTEFREMVDGLPGRYRLDPVDEKRKIISNAPAAYLTIAEPTRNGTGPVVVSQPDGPDSVMRELARANVEMARVNAEVSRNIADRFAGIMQAAAEVIRAADGAGIVARKPPELPVDDQVDDEVDEEGDDDEIEAAEPTFATLAAQILPMIQMWLQVKQAKARAMEKDDDIDQTKDSDEETTKAPVRNAAPTPAQMAHLMAVQKLLTPEEAQVAQATAMKLSPEDRADLLAELEELSVEEAAKFVRSMLPKMKGAAS